MNNIIWLSNIVSKINKVSPQYCLNKKDTLITFVNPLSINVLKKNNRYKNNLQGFDYIFVDGILLVLALNFYLSEHKIRRYSFDGNSIGIDFLNYFKITNKRVALIGGVEGASKKAGDILERNGLVVVFTYSGYFESREHRESVFNQIIKNDVEVVLAAMGAGYQESFLIELKKYGWKGVGITCGGYLDQIVESESEIYYPGLINKLNLRWLYRLYKEPRRISKRYFYEYIDFYKDFVKIMMKRKE